MTNENRKPSCPARVWIRCCAPSTWLSLAALIIALFVVEHLLGWRDYTSILSGTLPAEGTDLKILFGLLYAVTWFAAVVVAPILVIGSSLNYAIMRKE